MPKPFYASEEQTDARMIYVGAGSSGGRLAVDNHAEFMLARDDSNVALNWCNAGTFKWSFGFFSFDGPRSEYPSFNSKLNGSTAVTFDGGDKLRMILEPGQGYTLPDAITDGKLSIELWVVNPSVAKDEVLIRFEDNAVVSGYAIVKRNAIIRDDARVTDFARIEDRTIVENKAHVMEHAWVSNNKQISDYAVIKGSAINQGNISGTAIIDGNYLKNGDHDKGYWFLWSWGDYLQPGEVDKEFKQLYLEYQFEQQNGYRVWDTYGITWGRLVNGPTYVSDNGGTALKLDGQDDFVDLHQSVGQFERVSFDADVKWDGGGKGQKLINFSNSTTGDEAWLSPSDSQGKLAFSITVGGSTQVVRASKPLPSGSWKNVKLVTYGDTVTIHVDDIEWASSSSITHDIDEISANECYIGRGASGGNFDGRIDDFTVWSKPLIEDTPTDTPAPVSPRKAGNGGGRTIAGDWTNKEGKTIQATLTGVNGDKVMFRLASGKSVSYPIANLAPESQDKVKAFAKAMKAAKE